MILGNGIEGTRKICFQTRKYEGCCESDRPSQQQTTNVDKLLLTVCGEFIVTRCSKPAAYVHSSRAIALMQLSQGVLD